MSLEDILTVSEAASLADRSIGTINNYCRQQWIKARFADKKIWLIDKQSLLLFLADYKPKRGVGKPKDITGQRFGRLTVLEYSFSKSQKPYWLCRCDCGNEKIIRGQNFVSGRTKSCGQCQNHSQLWLFA